VRALESPEGTADCCRFAIPITAAATAGRGVA
jgi:hypothetical protein